MTIPVNRLRLMAFAFGAMVAALAGTMFAAPQVSVCPAHPRLSPISRLEDEPTIRPRIPAPIITVGTTGRWMPDPADLA